MKDGCGRAPQLACPNVLDFAVGADVIQPPSGSERGLVCGR